MAKTQIKDPKAVVCFIIAILCFSCIIVLFIIGGTMYSTEHPKVVNYANNTCQVDSSSFKIYQCKARYYTYSCYGPTWNVRYGEQKDIFALVEISTRYRSHFDAMAKADEYEIGSSYSCWYDRRNPSTAQWNQPSTRVAVILLCCGGLSVLLTGLFAFLAITLIKQQIRQNRQDNMGFVSYPSSYT